MRLSKTQRNIMYTLWAIWEEDRRASIAVDEMAVGMFGWWALYRLQKRGFINVFMGPGQKEYIAMSRTGVEYAAAASMLEAVQKAKEKVIGLKNTAHS